MLCVHVVTVVRVHAGMCAAARARFARARVHARACLHAAAASAEHLYAFEKFSHSHPLYQRAYVQARVCSYVRVSACVHIMSGIVVKVQPLCFHIVTP